MSKLFYGVAYNSKGKHKANTRAYNTWRKMLGRCYCPKYHAVQPTYVGCTVDGRWLDFQDFGNWFYDNPYSGMGYHLDKDLLLPGNKIYAPDRCCFVPRELNNLLTDHGNARGQYKQGVRFHKGWGKFEARIRIDGKLKGLGCFDTETEAYSAYKVAKEANVKRMALEWQDRIADNVFQALMRRTLDN